MVPAAAVVVPAAAVVPEPVVMVATLEEVAEPVVPVQVPAAASDACCLMPSLAPDLHGRALSFVRGSGG
ncbi:hypothetical protein HHA04nite_19150 [Halomonas halophila]|uniref:Secreted protein n=1 Tax=Halomonas halophila TaxID=29573 RepID=A0ABQ0U5E3_9GAMM|nr:hypothetical protein HHA04nite_19150 [Halomonas halophila]